jgi:hypothetical protein
MLGYRGGEVIVASLCVATVYVCPVGKRGKAGANKLEKIKEEMHINISRHNISRKKGRRCLCVRPSRSSPATERILWGVVPSVFFEGKE